MGPKVGGTPDLIANGATLLGKVANAVDSTSAGFTSSGSQASGAARRPRVSAAIDRFRAAFSRYSSDLGAQFGAAYMLAQHSSQDLATAGGNGPSGTSRGPGQPR